MVNYGGFWIRVAAYLIDAILLGAVGGVIGMLLGVGFLGAAGADPADANALAGTQLVVNLISIVLGWLYFALMESSARQATVGKMALGLTVTDLDGGRIGFGRATGRYFAKWISAIIIGIGFIMVAFTERKQGLHDLIASTLVLKARPGEAHTSAEVFS
ncbi:MAG: RDD family protein [Cypionkella sp.]